MLRWNAHHQPETPLLLPSYQWRASALEQR